MRFCNSCTCASAAASPYLLRCLWPLAAFRRCCEPLYAAIVECRRAGVTITNGQHVADAGHMQTCIAADRSTTSAIAQAACAVLHTPAASSTEGGCAIASLVSLMGCLWGPRETGRRGEPGERPRSPVTAHAHAVWTVEVRVAAGSCEPHHDHVGPRSGDWGMFACERFAALIRRSNRNNHDACNSPWCLV